MKPNRFSCINYNIYSILNSGTIATFCNGAPENKTLVLTQLRCETRCSFCKDNVVEPKICTIISLGMEELNYKK